MAQGEDERSAINDHRLDMNVAHGSVWPSLVLLTVRNLQRQPARGLGPGLEHSHGAAQRLRLKNTSLHLLTFNTVIEKASGEMKR